MDGEIKLSELGFNATLKQTQSEYRLTDFEIGRVIAEYKEKYVVKTVEGEFEAEITGNLRFSAAGREDFPAVGDWVALTLYETGLAIIRRVFPRYSVIKRKSAGNTSEVQVIAANIDFALVVLAAGRDFNVNRVERYLTICHASGVKPVLVITKIDLICEEKLKQMKESLRVRAPKITVVAVSNETKEGYGELNKVIQKGKTYCMLGSSGAGKSTILNHLSGGLKMRTGEISGSTSKGRHTTTHRELVPVKNGGIFIDNPGMKEVGVADTQRGVEYTFELITALAKKCKYKDCTHTSESGCAVTSALQNKTLDRAQYENYLKIQKEREYFQTGDLERQRIERHRKEKIFGKRQKEYKKQNIKRRKQ